MRPDDFKPRQIITITGSTAPAEHDSDRFCHCPKCSQERMERQSESFISLKGTPLMVQAVNLPFLAVTLAGDPEHVVHIIDTREYRFVPANHRYVAIAATRYTEPPQKQASAKKSRDCPECGHKLTEQRTASGSWQRVCKECGTTITIGPKK